MPKAYIGMGGNLPSRAGRPEATLTKAAERMGAWGCVTRRSSLYKTEPVGFADQSWFVNAVVELETELSPRELLKALLEVEREFGRNRRAEIRNGPRTLDLDVLLFDELVISEPGLEIPHPRLAERAFALIPLNEISPVLVHPGLNRTVSQLLHELRTKDASQRHEAISVHWNDWTSCAGLRPERGEDSGATP